MSADNLGLAMRPRCPSTIRFSVIVTCYNQAQFIQDAVESVSSLPYASKEVIVVDDGSTDNSVDLLRRYRDSVELLILPVNRGVGEARNQGAAVARGEYLIFLDGDDLLTPWALEVY